MLIFLFALIAIRAASAISSCIGASIGDVIVVLNSSCDTLEGLSDHVTLRRLKVTDCRLADLPIGLNLSKLSHVSLDGNLISTVKHDHFSGWPDLMQLDMSRNHVTVLPPYLFTNNSKLRIVDFSRNNISTVSPDFLGGLASLQYLYLSQNSIEVMPPEVAYVIEHLLELSGNPLQAIQRSSLLFSPKVQRLKMSKCLISYIEPHSFAGMSSTAYLYLNSNKISQLDGRMLDGLDGLELLDVSDNLIRRIAVGTFSVLVALRSLNLSTNLLENVQAAIEEPKRLEELDLSHNRLREIFILETASYPITIDANNWSCRWTQEYLVQHKSRLKFSKILPCHKTESMVELQQGVWPQYAYWSGGFVVLFVLAMLLVLLAMCCRQMTGADDRSVAAKEHDAKHCTIESGNSVDDEDHTYYEITEPTYIDPTPNCGVHLLTHFKNGILHEEPFDNRTIKHLSFYENLADTD